MYIFSSSRRTILSLLWKFRINSLKEGITSQTGFLVLASTIGYICGYLYVVCMGRALGPEVFGILGSLVAIFYIACLVSQALTEAIASNVAEIKAREGKAVAIATFRRLGIKLGVLSFLPAICFVLASPQIAHFFHLNSVIPVIILAFSLSTTLILGIFMGLLQGLQAFKGLGIINYLISQGLKLLLGIVFVLVGWSLAGAVWALLASTSIAIFAALVQTRKRMDIGNHNKHQLNLALSPVLIPTLILAIFMAVPASVDVMLVTHFFSATKAGLYNAVATLGKVTMFLPMAVSFVLLPKAIERHTLGLNSMRVLLRSLLYASVLSGVVALIYWSIPDLIIRIFFGPDYIEASRLIGWYAFAMLLFSLNFVFIHYSLAVRNIGLIIIADIFTLAQVGAIALMHQSLLQVIIILLLGNLLILFCSFLVLIVSGRSFAHRRSLKG